MSASRNNHETDGHVRAPENNGLIEDLVILLKITSELVQLGAVVGRGTSDIRTAIADNRVGTHASGKYSGMRRCGA